jgi:hypothetical protein
LFGQRIPRCPNPENFDARNRNSVGFTKPRGILKMGDPNLLPEFITVAGGPPEERSPAKEARLYITGTDDADFNTLASQHYVSGDFWMLGLKVVNENPHNEKGEEDNRHEAATQG